MLYRIKFRLEIPYNSKRTFGTMQGYTVTRARFSVGMIIFFNHSHDGRDSKHFFFYFQFWPIYIINLVLMYLRNCLNEIVSSHLGLIFKSDHLSIIESFKCYKIQ